LKEECLSNKALFYFLIAPGATSLSTFRVSEFLFSLSFEPMKKCFLPALVLLFVFACNANDDGDAAGKPENDVDAARMFIRDALDGNYKKARKLVLQDSSNVQLLDNLERAYLHNNDATEQRGYREASIRIHETKKINDTVSVVVYSNSFKNKKDSVKTVKIGNDWLVDLKYSFPQTNIRQ